MLLPIQVPEGFQVIVSSKDKVEVGQVVAKKDSQVKEQIIEVAKEAGVQPSKVIKILTKSLGERVSQGDIVALKKGAIGIKKTKVYSPCDGTLVKLEEDTGNLIVKATVKLEKEETIESPVTGEIESVEDGKILVKTDKNAISILKIFGNNAKGKIKTLEDELLDFDNLPKEIQNLVLVGKDFSKAAVFKAFAVGAKAIITKTLSDEDKVIYEEKEISECFVLLSEAEYDRILRLKDKDILIDKEKKIIIVL